MSFHIQERSITTDIWVMPVSYRIKGIVRATNVSVLEQTIREAADVRTLSFPTNLRIVTDDGEPVSRWKVWPGRAKKLRRRY